MHSCHPFLPSPPGTTRQKGPGGPSCLPHSAAVLLPAFAPWPARSPVSPPRPHALCASERPEWGVEIRFEWVTVYPVSVGHRCPMFRTIAHFDFSSLLKCFTEFFLGCLYDLQWPRPQIKQMLVSHLFLEVPFVGLEVKWLPCDFCDPMCLRRVTL